MQHRKLPGPYREYGPDYMRLVQRYLAASDLVPDWGRVVLSWERDDGTWTIPDDTADTIHAAGVAIMWIGQAGVTRITTADGEATVGGGAPAGPPPANNAPDVTAWLPTTRTVPGGEVVTRNVIMFGPSTQWPTQAEWTSPSRIQLRIFNPADSGTNLHVGYGLIDNLNQQGQPDIVPPGSEWVSDMNDARPVFARAATGAVWGILESRKVA